MSRRLAFIIAAAALSLVAVSGAVVASEPALDLDDPVSSGIIEPMPDEIGATPIEPDPTVTNPLPHAWDRIVVSPDGLTLSVYFWNGIEDCYGLHSVEVSETDSGIGVQLYTGTAAGAEDVACIEIAELFVTTVTLDEPLITNTQG